MLPEVVNNMKRLHLHRLIGAASRSGLHFGIVLSTVVCPLLHPAVVRAQDTSRFPPMIGDFGPDRLPYPYPGPHRALYPYPGQYPDNSVIQGINTAGTIRPSGTPVLQVHAKIIGNQPWSNRHRTQSQEAVKKVRATPPAEAVNSSFLNNSIAEFEKESGERKKSNQTLEAALSRCAAANCLYYCGKAAEARAMYDEALSLLDQPNKASDECNKNLVSAIALNKTMAEKVINDHLSEPGAANPTDSNTIRVFDYPESGLAISGQIAWIIDLDEIEYTPAITKNDITPNLPGRHRSKLPSAWEFPD